MLKNNRYSGRIYVQSLNRLCLFGIVLIIANNCFSQNFSENKNRIAKGLAGSSSSFTEVTEDASDKLNGDGIRFTPNKGQIVDKDGRQCPDVLYKGDGGGGDIYLRKTGISYVYNNMGEVTNRVEEQVEELILTGKIDRTNEQEKKQELMQKQTMKIHRVDMDFVNCLPSKVLAKVGNSTITTTNDASSVTGTLSGAEVSVKEEDSSEGYINYYYAHCPQGITNVNQYNKVSFKNIYENIDVNYYGNKEAGIKYDLIVKPHGDPHQIKLCWKGAESIYLNSEGKLVIRTSQ